MLSSGILLLSSLMLGAEAVEWPDLSVPVQQATSKSKDRAIIIALEEYESFDGVRNATINADDWAAYFTQGLGLPASQVSVLTDESASRMRIANEVKRAARKVRRSGNLWIVYIGHGVTMYDTQEAAILPYYTQTETKGFYENAISTSELALWLGKTDSKSVLLFDTTFNGQDRNGQRLIDTLPIQEGVLPTVTKKTTVLSAASVGETAGYLIENGRPAFSYLVLGALRGWSDTDDNGWMSLLESVEYADMVLGGQTPSAQGRLRRKKVSEALEDGPSLVRERSPLQAVDPMSTVPEGMIQENVSLESLLGELEQQRAYEVKIQTEIDEQVAEIRTAAAQHWKRVRAFAAQRVDDPARVAVYAFLREYQNVVIQVQGQEFEVDVPEVQLAQQLLSQLATPEIQGVEFTWIAGGVFDMGNAQLSSLSHSVRLSRSFYVSKTEVTQALYEFVLSENPSEVQGEQLPVTNVSWFDAVRFANALSAYEGFEQCYEITGEDVSFPMGTSCLGYRLPTEAEWEFMARANTTGGFSGGDRVGKIAWVESNGGQEVHFVGQKSANAFGLYDLSGNVSEWIWDWYGEYQVSDNLDPVGAHSGTYRVQRGGSVMSGIQQARVDARHPVKPSYVSPFQGFRVVRTVPE